jgi:flagellar basal-body rod protein FlgC
MSLFDIFNVSSSALNAQSQRLNTVASNLANADSATSATGEPYRAKQVVFSATPADESGATGVEVVGVVDDPSPMKSVYDPKNPLADEKGYVTMPNVNVVEEMVNMISASRSYQSNVEVMNTAKTLLLKTLTLGQ